MARLTKEQVAELLRLRTENNMTQHQLAAHFGITQPAVFNHLKKNGLTKERQKVENV